MTDEQQITWVVTYQDPETGERRALTWGLNENDAMQQADLAASIGLQDPRAERADRRQP